MVTRPIALILALSLCVSNGLASQAREEALRAQLLAESFVSGKAAVAKKIAALGTEASRAVLVQLLSADSSWDRSGAFLGLLSLKDAQTSRLLAEAYAKDSSLDSFVTEAVASDAARFVPRWKELWADPAWNWERERILRAIGMARNPEAAAFLEGIIRSDSPYRDEAFDAYAAARRTGDLALARYLCSDQALKPRALALLAAIGGSGDLSIFEREFFGDGRPEARMGALQGIVNWGGAELKERAFVSALESDSALLRETSCSLLAGIRSPRLMALAAASAARVEEPFAAIAAAEYLSGYGTREGISAAVPAFKAEYRARPASFGFGDWLAGVVTLGLSHALDRYNASSTEASFRKRKEELARVLSALAGKKMGPDYQIWETWCLSEGLSVAGRNIVQELFSSLPARRDAAREWAVKLLGKGSEASFAASDAAYAAADGYERALRLAALLRAAGWPKGFQ